MEIGGLNFPSYGTYATLAWPITRQNDRCEMIDNSFLYVMVENMDVSARDIPGHVSPQFSQICMLRIPFQLPELPFVAC